MTKAFSIRVPASTANLGPGFDSVGLALNLFLNLEVEYSDTWKFHHKSPELKGLPTNEKHLIYQVVNQVSQKYGVLLQPCTISITSDIPLARGLGSSASAIIAGIELANQLGQLQLSQQEKLYLATEIEGHPDNVGASLYGGLVVGSYFENEVQLLSFTKLQFETVVMIPATTLLTKESRQVLPKELAYNSAVVASSIANLLVASMLSENWDMAGKMMEKDLFHHPFRKKLISNYDMLEKVAKENGAFGVAISGAGPTVIAFVEKGHGRKLQTKLQGVFQHIDLRLLEIAKEGSQVIKKSDSV